jgi:hypothetical protein
VLAVALFLWLSGSLLTRPLAASVYDLDTWDHTAALRAWSSDLGSPGNPHLATDDPSPRYMPYFLPLAITARLLDLDPIAALSLGGIATAALLLAAIFAFHRVYFASAWAPVVGLLVLSSGWGVGWLWSNLYQLRGLFYIVSFPSSFVFALALLSLAVAVQVLRGARPARVSAVLLAALVSLMVLCHPLTGAFALASLLLLAVTEPGAPLRRRAVVGLAVAVGALAAGAWPFFSLVELGTSVASSAAGVGDDTASRASQLYRRLVFYRPGQVLVTLGPALLGLPVLVHLLRARVQLFIAAGALAMAVPYFANLVVAVPFGHRFLLFAVFYLHLALTWAVLRTGPDFRDALAGATAARGSVLRAGAVTGALALAVAWNVGLAARDLSGSTLAPTLRSESTASPVVEVMRLVAHTLPDDAVVLAAGCDAWPLPTFAAKVVAACRANLLVPDRIERRADVARFFDANTEASEMRDIIARYGATHVLYVGPVPGLAARLRGFGDPGERVGEITIVELRNR